jgi:hypothetical protein
VPGLRPAVLRACIDCEVLTQIVALILRATSRGGSCPARIEAAATGHEVSLRVTSSQPGADVLFADQPAVDVAVAGGLAAVYGGSIREAGPGEGPGVILLLPAAEPASSAG